MSNFFPGYEVICKGLGISPQTLSEEHLVMVTTSMLRLLIKNALESAPFDEASYLRFNPDITDAKARGEIADLHRHYIDHGYLEGRRAFEQPLDEKWYLKANRDVAIAVRAGEVGSAAEHYQGAGEREWRAPNQAAFADVNRWREVMLAMQREVAG